MDWDAALTAFNGGELIAYPTEAVFGLGCDPRNESAVQKLLALKQRPLEKGVILIAADYSQLVPYVADLKIPQDKRFSVLSHWPGPITLVLPAAEHTPRWLTGGRDTIAVRVTAHEPARQLCKALGSAIVSTSANVTGAAPVTTAAAVREAFGEQIAWIMEAPVGQLAAPTKIINPLTQQVVRE